MVQEMLLMNRQKQKLEEKEWIPPKTLTPDNWTTEATPEIRDAIMRDLRKEFLNKK